MSNQDLNSALEACLALINEQGAGVEDCLNQFPQHREALRRMVPVALRLGRARSLAAPEGLQAAIAAQVAAIPRANTRFLPGFLVTNLTALRSIVQTRNATPQRRAWMIPAIVTFMIVTVLSMSGLVASADAAGPGDLLFNLDTAIEDVRLNFAQDEEHEAELRVEFATERLEELRIEIEGEGEQQNIKQALQEFQEALAALEALLGELTPEQRAAFEEALAMLVAASPNLSEFEFEFELEDGKGEIELEIEAEGDGDDLDSDDVDDDDDLDDDDLDDDDLDDDDLDDDDLDNDDLEDDDLNDDDLDDGEGCDSSGPGSGDCPEDEDEEECDSSGSGSGEECEHDEEDGEDEPEEHGEDEEEDEEDDEEDDN